jgi:glycerol-3-phosphate acyltransferase PlsY
MLYGAYIAGMFTILGHLFPVFFGFKGGKGIATSLGVILALQPLVALALLSVFLIVLLISKMVSLGSVIGISLYPVFTLLWALFFGGRLPLFTTVCAALIAALIIWMHRGNMQRIRAGTEFKFGRKKKQQEAENDQPVEESGQTADAGD